MATQSSSAVLAGPHDRESFFEAQRRNRRATWRLSAVSALATVVMGVPLALTITPLLYATALIIADIVNIWAPLPPSLWQRADELARYGLLVIEWLGGSRTANPQSLVIGAVILILPGAILSIGLWLGVNALFCRAGVGGALLALKARDPNPSNLKELQLSDVVQEMAIAAGLPAPRIMLIDASAANAAAIGTSPNDARIVITSGLLERLNRDELEGALAHLIASIGNGDLRIAFRVTSVFETYSLLLAIVNAPFGSQARRQLWRVVRCALARKRNKENDAEEAAAVAALLSRGATLETDDIDNLFDATSKKKSALRSIRNFLLFPIFFTNFAIKLSLWFFSFTMLGPSMALLWRKRVYLADASAVQFTRNPDGLAEALRKLNSERRSIPGAASASHLFLVSPTGGEQIDVPKADVAQQQKFAKLWTATARDGKNNSAAQPLTSPSLMLQIAATSQAAMAGDANATARLSAFREAAAAFSTPVDELPNLADIAAAQHGDKVALEHLLKFSNKMNTNRSAKGDGQESSTDSSGGFAGFHPSLKRRLKRLDRMGAHVELESAGRGAWIVIAVLSIFLGPFALLALALLLLLIAILTMSSLAFIAVWMAFIHELFVVFAHH